MKDILKSFLMGVGFATGFFAAISFTADAEDLAAEAETREFVAYQNGLTEGAKQASAKGWRSMFAESK